MLTAGSSPDGCPNNWQKFTSSICFQYVVDYLNFQDAINRCNSINGSLALIDSEDKQFFVGNLQGNQSSIYWIGLRDIRSENDVANFQWYPSKYFLSDTGYSSWADSYPKSYKDQCVYISSGLWNNVACATSLPYLCEISIFSYTSIDIMLIC